MQEAVTCRELCKSLLETRIVSVPPPARGQLYITQVLSTIAVDLFPALPLEEGDLGRP